MTALRIIVEMTAQSCGTATPNREQSFQLRPCQRRSMAIDEIVTDCIDNVGQLNRWSIHFGISLRDLRTRLPSVISSASRGLAAECK